MKKVLKKLLCLVMLVMVLVATSTTIFVSAYDNLATNGGFESGTTNWLINGAGTDATVKTDSTTKKSGNYSLKIADTSTSLMPRVSRFINIDATKTYTLKYSVKSDVNTAVQVLLYDNGKTLIGTATLIITKPSTGFTDVTKTISPLPNSTKNINIGEGATRVLIQLWPSKTIGAAGTGTVWYDDIYLGEGEGEGGAAPVETNPTPTPTPTPAAMFNDIGSHWAKADIIEMASAGLIKGKGEGKFDPESSITRAEFLALATRAAGLGVLPYQGMFTDVKADAWYSGVVQVAYDNKIIDENMIANKAFNPTAQITREEMTSIIINTYKLKKQIEIKDIVSTKFSDTASISKWALKYVDKATELGIIKGMTETTFAPSQTATRAQSAVILKRLLMQIK